MVIAWIVGVRRFAEAAQSAVLRHAQSDKHLVLLSLASFFSKARLHGHCNFWAEVPDLTGALRGHQAAQDEAMFVPGAGCLDAGNQRAHAQAATAGRNDAPAA
jgi:hypothetical protein